MLTESDDRKNGPRRGQSRLSGLLPNLTPISPVSAPTEVGREDRETPSSISSSILGHDCPECGGLGLKRVGYDSLTSFSGRVIRGECYCRCPWGEEMFLAAKAEFEEECA